MHGCMKRGILRTASEYRKGDEEAGMRIDLAGFGPGTEELTTGEVKAALSLADVIITSSRLSVLLENRPDLGQVIVETSAEKICRILEEQTCEYAVCLFGGDIGFYSGASSLLGFIRQSERLQEKKAKIRLLPGVSSLSLACARLGLSFRDVAVFSAHGRYVDPVRAVMNGKISFFLTSGSEGPRKLCEELTRSGLGGLKVTVCEMLSSPKEHIETMTAEEASLREYLPLSVLFAEPAPVSEYLRRGVPGIEDEAFVRGNVPMTKRFIRVSALSMLNPLEEDLCWDLGAGCGSVSIELSARCGRVICVEKDPEALRLMEENRKRFGAWNMEIVQGQIPGILDILPLPDKVFLGGGGRWIRQILLNLMSRASERTGRGMPSICASAVTLETLHEVTCALEEAGYETDIVQVAVTDVKKRGAFHMMDALNPVFLISGTGK